MEDFAYTLKIPKERIAVLIGEEGEIKHRIEADTKTKINVDSKEGDISITGHDAIGLFISREVVEAIGRGFNPDVARLLLKSDYILELINIKEYSGKSKADFIRLKGRVIGEEGKCRRTIENLSDVHLSIYGKTIGIIGEADKVASARRALTDILSGAPHGNVYKALERRRVLLEQKRFEDERGIKK